MWVNTKTEEIKLAISTINNNHGTRYELLNRFDNGEWGAYRIAEPEKKPVVLKFFTDLSNTNIVDADPRLAKMIANRLLSLGHPVPRYIYTGQFDKGLYWVQEELTGNPLWRDPTVEQIEKILSLLLLQKNQAVSDKQDYSQIVKDTVFGNKSGGLKAIRNYSSEMRKFLDNLVLEIKNLESLPLSNLDIVHGDFSYHQVLVDNNGNITGIIDWQESGCGDWLIDLARLIYSLHDRPYLAKHIIKHVRQVELSKIKLYTAFTAIEMLRWPIQQNQKNVESSFNKAKSAVNFVFVRNCVY